MRQALAIVRRRLREVLLSPPSKYRDGCETTLKELEEEYLEIMWDEGIDDV